MMVVGVLGGYGPHATAHFFQQLINATPAKKDWEHLHIIVNNNPKVPSRGRAFLYGEEDPTPKMLEEVTRLKDAGADFFVCPCNSAHHFLKKVERFPLPFIDMVSATVNRIVDLGYTKPLLIGSEVTMQGGIYQKEALKHGLTIDSYSYSEIIRSVIEAGKTGIGIKEARAILLDIIAESSLHYDCLILGCTELPLVISQNDTLFPLIDTSQILVEETVKHANI